MSRKRVIPVVPMRGMTVLPGRVDHFDIGRRRSMAAVEEAMLANEQVLLVTQRNPEDLDPDADALFEYGTLAGIRQLARLPQDMGRVMVEGVSRARIIALYPGEKMMTAEVEEAPFIKANPSAPASIAMLRVLRDRLKAYAEGNRPFAEKFLNPLLRITDINRLMFRAAADLTWEWSIGQKILDCDTAEELYAVLTEQLTREIEVSSIRREFQAKLRENIDRNQKEYVLREQMKLIEQELGGETPTADADEYRERCEKLEASDEVKARIMKEIGRLRTMPGGGQEANVIRTYLDTLLELPWDHETKDNPDLDAAEEILEKDHYGLEKVKERVIEYLAVRMLNPKSRGPILCLVGPPGTGKTSIARSVARALDKKYVRISLGGVRDEAEIRGHRKTYVGAMPGRIVDALRQAGSANPLMLLDEVDKVSPEYLGATSSALLEVLDGEQNVKFRDHYVELPIDLSKVLFIATANTMETIPGPLIDRMEIIEISSYTENEKFHIAKDYLVKKQAEANGIPEGRVEFTDEAIMKIIRSYTREAGVRSCERRIGDVYRKCAREILKGRKRKIRITENKVREFLGKEKVRPEDRVKPDQVGIVRGLAWTSAGGATLEIEVNVMPGKGALQLTGRMGDVMKESAMTALSCVRAAAADYGVTQEFFEKNDIHIHIPEGAVPKDGPSAGVTMAVAMLSAAAGRKVRGNLAMTGEITLRGRILPIGGLKEKTLAAKAAGITKILVPEENRADIAELSAEITDGLSIVYIKEFREAVKQAFAAPAKKRAGDAEPDREKEKTE